MSRKRIAAVGTVLALSAVASLVLSFVVRPGRPEPGRQYDAAIQLLNWGGPILSYGALLLFGAAVVCWLLGRAPKPYAPAPRRAVYVQSGSRIRSSDGWYVETLGRGDMRYADGELVVRIGAELLHGDVLYVIYPSIMTLEASGTRAVLDDQTRSLIAARIQAAFAGVGRRVEVD